MMKLLRIYIGESQRAGRKPLYEAIVEAAHKKALAGATVTRGIMGFGKNSAIRTSKILRLSEDLPLVIDIIDTADRIDDFLPVLDGMVSQGLVITQDLDVQINRHGGNLTPPG